MGTVLLFFSFMLDAHDIAHDISIINISCFYLNSVRYRKQYQHTCRVRQICPNAAALLLSMCSLLNQNVTLVNVYCPTHFENGFSFASLKQCKQIILFITLASHHRVTWLKAKESRPCCGIALSWAWSIHRAVRKNHWASFAHTCT